MMPVDNAIGEWQALNAQAPTPLEFAVMFTLFVCLYRGVVVGWLRLALLLGLLHLALAHLRHEIVLGVAAPLLLAEPLGRVMEPERVKARAPAAPVAWAEIAAPALVAAALVLGAFAARLAAPLQRVDSDYVPVTALAHVPPRIAALPVFNDYSFGGWLVFKGVRPFIDGRADMYGNAFLRTYLDTERLRPPALADQTLRRYGVAWTILMPSSPLAARLDRTPGWRRLYADKWAVVQVRDDIVAPLAGTAAR